MLLCEADSVTAVPQKLYQRDRGPSAGSRMEPRRMTGFVDVVMQVAAIEMLSDEAAQIEQELQRLLAEVERTPVELHHDVFWERFMELLKRRGEVCRKTMILARHTRDDQRKNAGMGVGALHQP